MLVARKIRDRRRRSHRPMARVLCQSLGRCRSVGNRSASASKKSIEPYPYQSRTRPTNPFCQEKPRAHGHSRPRDRIGQRSFDHYPMDNQQSRRLPRALRGCALRRGCQEPDADGEIARQIKSGAPIHDFPSAIGRAKAAHNVITAAWTRWTRMARPME